MMKSAAVRRERIKAELVADVMLTDILSNLKDLDNTDSGIQAFLSVITISKPLKTMLLSILQKSRKNRASLKNCTPFTKRVLLFCLAQYAFLGDISDCELSFMSEKLPPLEAFLARLQDIDVAFGKYMRKDKSFSGKLYEISLHTVKQHVLMLMKKSEYSNAEKFISKQTFIKSNHRLVLENMIKNCLMKQGLLEKILKMKHHSYLGYYTAVAQFIQSLNHLLKGPVLEKFDQHCRTMDVSSIDSLTADEATNLVENGLSESDDEGDGDAEYQPLEIPMVGNPLPAKSVSDQVTEKTESQSVLSPKIGLAYRLKKSQSGIIIPCKHIVEHCRKATSEEDVDTNEGFFRMPASTVNKTANPARTVKHPTRGPLPKRRVLLGDRFETASAASNLDRSYRQKKKTLFTLEMDSYIAQGCLQFGVGNWASILRSFPFPRDCTNTKLKDRFRVLMRKNFIAVLNDGYISVLDKALKAKLATAKEQMIPLKKLTSQKDKGDSDSSPTKRTANQIMSPDLMREGSSSSHELPKEAFKHFQPLEDAYLVCGAMHLGLRWDAIKEYMDFRSHITLDDMQKRWEILLDKRAVEIVDGAVKCKDSELRQKCKDVAKQLESKILRSRKTYEHSQSSEESSVSEDSIIGKKRPGRAIVVSENESDDGHQPTGSSPVKVTRLNGSIDAGTQTSKPKFHLGNRSPSTLEASSSSGNASEQSSIQLAGGSPIRPSMINLFKSKRSPHKDKTSPILKEMRQKRQRVLERLQRRDQTVQRKQWTDVETSTFLEMLSKHGPGKWSMMLDDGYDGLKERTPVMIKDKYRNLLQRGFLPDDIIKKWQIRKADET